MSEPKRITEKYLAGFIDGDGSIFLRFIQPSKDQRYYAKLMIEGSQRREKDKVLYLIQQTFGGRLREKIVDERPYTVWELSDKQAVMVLYRIVKYLIIRKECAKACLAYLEARKKLPYGERGFVEDDVQVQRDLTSQFRFIRSPMPNYPPRQWLAGFFDSDGSIRIGLSVGQGWTRASFNICIGDDDRMDVGLKLLQKAYGGSIGRQQSGEHSIVWQPSTQPSFLKKFFWHFAKHSIVKRAEIYFVLGCCDGGNFRDGAAISAAFQEIRAKEHRLNNPEVDVSPWLRKLNFAISKESPRAA